MNRRAVALFALAGLISTVAIANILTTEYGMIPVGFGLTATAGTYLAGLAFVLRDTLQDYGNRAAVLAAVAVGALLSYGLAVTVFEANPVFLPPGVTPVSIAVASGVAFLISELADFAVYTPLRKRGYIRAATASNIVGSVVDTFLFLWIAGFTIAGAWQGQLVAKLTVTAVAMGLVWAYRRTNRAPVPA